MNTRSYNDYIELNPEINNREWYKDTKTVCLFVHLLITVNHEQTESRGVIIPPRSMLVSYDTLSNELKMSPKEIRAALKKLGKCGDVANKTVGDMQLITLVETGLYKV